MIGNAVAAVEARGPEAGPDRCDGVRARARAARCVGRAVAPTSSRAGEAPGIIHITSGLTNIAVVERGVPRFTRVSALGGNQFTQAIANVMNLTFDEAEQLKIRSGLPPLDGAATASGGVDPETARVAQEALERETNQFIAEVRRSLDYYLTQATQVRRSSASS